MPVVVDGARSSIVGGVEEIPEPKATTVVSEKTGHSCMAGKLLTELFEFRPDKRRKHGGYLVPKFSGWASYPKGLELTAETMERLCEWFGTH